MKEQCTKYKKSIKGIKRKREQKSTKLEKLKNEAREQNQLLKDCCYIAKEKENELKVNVRNLKRVNDEIAGNRPRPTVWCQYMVKTLKLFCKKVLSGNNLCRDSFDVEAQKLLREYYLSPQIPKNLPYERYELSTKIDEITSERQKNLDKLELIKGKVRLVMGEVKTKTDELEQLDRQKKFFENALKSTEKELFESTTDGRHQNLYCKYCKYCKYCIISLIAFIIFIIILITILKNSL